MCIAGAAIGYDEQALARAVQGMAIEYEIGLPGEGAETEVFFSDLGHEYIPNQRRVHDMRLRRPRRDWSEACAT